jgi:dihydropteroate synthase
LQALEKARTQRGFALMGVCNVTPDSFHDGGLAFTPEAARARIDELVREGADLLDIGGESTRPGAPRVPARGQIERVLPVVRYAASRAVVSIDTSSPEVAEACLDAGASLVNDVSCLADPALARVVAAKEAALVLMHARPGQESMTGFGAVPEEAYVDVVADVAREWIAARDRAIAAGLAHDAILFDPGLGFMKSARHSAELVRRLPELARAVGAPVLVGASHKSFLTLVDPDATPCERIGASLGAAIAAVEAGASILRVHDVRATRQAILALRAFAPAAPPRPQASQTIQPAGGASASSPISLAQEIR